MHDYIKRRKEAERNERITRIVNAGTKVFLKRGYFNTTIRDIAREAELSPGAIYYYFSGIDEIYTRICLDAFHIVIDLMTSAVNKGGSAMEKLERLALAYFEFYRNHPDYFELFVFRNLGYRKTGLSESHYEQLDALQKKSVKLVHDVLEEGINSGEIMKVDSWKLSIALWAAVEGLLTINAKEFLSTYKLEIQDLMELQIAILTRGVRE